MTSDGESIDTRDRSQLKSVPVGECQFRGEVEIGDNGEGSKTAPFKMVARTGDAIDHPYWGRVVHDLSGMLTHKARLPIDFNHDPSDIIGYANRFDHSSGDLEVSGALVPYKDNDRASEIVHKQRNGVPYEASIDFSGAKLKVEEVPEGVGVEVNGRQFTGPINVIRQWSLRGVAVCPYGADRNTLTAFSNPNATQEVEIMATEQATIEPETEEAPAATEAVETVTDNDSAEATPAVEATTEAPAVEQPAEPQPEPAQLSAPGAKFLEAFGDQGGVWFAQGKSFEECQSLFVANMRKENEELRNQLSALNAGEDSPVKFKSEKAPQANGKGRGIRFAGDRK